VEPAIAERMAPDGAREIEAAGVIDGKFGNVTLLRPMGRDYLTVLPAASQAGRRSQSPDVRLDLPGQQLAGTALREPRCTGAVGGLGDERREPVAPRTLLMMATSRQGSGFHETFAPGLHYSAPVWRN
jgi:hypothetical protein